MRILHTESSRGWGGQEIRILREAHGMRERGHEIVFAVAQGGGLVDKARRAGFTVYEVTFKKSMALVAIPKLLRILREHKIDLINTHSSTDAWLAGLAGRIARKKIVRTRHLSTPIRKGLNSRLLYKGLADFVVTTSSGIIPIICKQARIPLQRCRCIPTGIDVAQLHAEPEAAELFRQKLGLKPEDILVGTVCFVRSWKGIHDLMKAAHLLRHLPNLKWVIVGGGYVDQYRGTAEELGLQGILHFTGHLESPFAAIQAMDIFTLLSTAHEGVSQASLQAAYFGKPLITTTVGGLPEVCLNGKTGLHVPPFSPEKVVEAVQQLMANAKQRQEMGKQAKELVLNNFNWLQTLDQMESVFKT